MPPPSRFRPAAQAASVPFSILLTSSNFDPLRVVVGEEGPRDQISSLSTWMAILAHFHISSSSPSQDEQLFDVTTLMAFILDPRSGLSVGALKADKEYSFDRVGALAHFGSTVTESQAEYSTARRVSFVYDERMLLHVSQDARIPEAPVRVERAYDALMADPIVAPILAAHRIPSRLAEVEEILLVHPGDGYRSFLEGGVLLRDALGPLKTDVYDCPSTRDAVRIACASAIDATQCVWSEGAQRGEPASAFCLIRPPGHHCSSSTPSGFCIANNVVVAARNLQRKCHQSGQQPKIAILDLDVHHGEGTQGLVQDDPSILYVSTHRYDSGTFYPFGEVGSAAQCGTHKNVLNIPFDTASTDPAKCYAVMSDYALESSWERLIRPELDVFRPDIMVVSLGFDAAYGDPLGRMAVDDAFATILQRIMMWSAETSWGCRGAVCVLEGGYQPSVVAEKCVECVKALAFWGSISHKSPSYPKTWKDVRLKLQRRQTASADQTESETPSNTVIMPNDEALWELHKQWVDDTIQHVNCTRRV